MFTDLGTTRPMSVERAISNAQLATSAATSNSKRTAFTPTRIIPGLYRHETMLADRQFDNPSPSAGSISPRLNKNRTAYCPSRIIPQLCRHETMISDPTTEPESHSACRIYGTHLNGRRTIYSPFRIIPRLCRHETMLSDKTIETVGTQGE